MTKLIFDISMSLGRDRTLQRPARGTHGRRRPTAPPMGVPPGVLYDVPHVVSFGQWTAENEAVTEYGHTTERARDVQSLRTPPRSAVLAERKRSGMSTTPTAQRFIEELEAYRSPEQEKYQRYFKTGKGQYGEGDEFIGVRMGQIFALAKEFIEMLPARSRSCSESPVHEARAGA